MEPSPVPSLPLERLYRFALLLSGRAKSAEAALAAALADLEKNAGQLRSAAHRQAWLANRIRNHCVRTPVVDSANPVALGLIREQTDGAESDTAPLLAIEAYLLAQRFARLAEPGRSALALHYLDLVSAAEAASLLGLNWERYCEQLRTARAELKLGVLQMRSQPLAV